MANYLDKDGVLYLWSKVKALFNKGITGLSVNGRTITYTKGDGTTGTITTQDTNTTYGVATTSTNGLMSSSDKTKLNGIASGAEVNQNAFSTVELYQNLTFSDPTKTINAGAKKDKLVLKGDGEVEVYYGGDSGNDIILGLGLGIATSSKQ